MKLANTILLVAVGLSAASLATTAATPTALAQDQVDAPAPADADVSEAYYYVAPDVRRCAAPYCGGVFVAKVNRLLTRCPGGYYLPICYVAELDVEGLGLASSALADDLWRRQVLVRGELQSTTSDGHEGLGRLVATEAWSSPTVSLFGGQIVRVEDSGIRCITSPCPSLVATAVNSTASIELAELQFDDCAGTEADVEAATTQLYSDDGLLVIGRRVTVTGPAGEATGAAVSQFFVRLVVADNPDEPREP